MTPTELFAAREALVKEMEDAWQAYGEALTNATRDYQVSTSRATRNYLAAETAFVADHPQ